MDKIPVIAVFDVGKTNKKLVVFDKRYQIVEERTVYFDETTDEDGYPCEDLEILSSWIKESIKELVAHETYDLKAINFTAFGASFVHTDETGKPITALYSYLKPYPEHIKAKFYQTYGGELQVTTETASPVLGSLNSGMQLYRLKYEQPELFHSIKHSLHLPQFLSFLVSGDANSDITSTGCHTKLWDFAKNSYHDWVQKEHVAEKLPPIVATETAALKNVEGKDIVVGVGIHDSSSALIPFFNNFHEPFALIATGTWCITLNPFNDSPPTAEELAFDCLCYLNHQAKPVKASRLFLGAEHDEQSKRIAKSFGLPDDFYMKVEPDVKLFPEVIGRSAEVKLQAHKNGLAASGFANRKLSDFGSAAEAYHQLMADLISLQVQSSRLVLNDAAKHIFVDGGFSKNELFMRMLATALPGKKVFAASVAQATSLGAAQVIHKHWNSRPFIGSIIDLKFYSAQH